MLVEGALDLGKYWLMLACITIGFVNRMQSVFALIGVSLGVPWVA